MQYRTILVTGGCGFIGSHFIKYIFKKYPKIKIINLDLLTYAANQNNLEIINKSARYKFIKGDIGDFSLANRIIKSNLVDCVVNFAAESDNNRAINFPVDFVKTNVLGTTILLEAARKNKIKRFHHISTCEVFGQLSLKTKEEFSEDSPFKPRTPYNASKAAADHIIKSYYYTFGLPVTISHCCNNYGSHQFPEKVIPVFILKALKNEPLPIFKSSKNKREWIHVLDHCHALDLILQKGKLGEQYNIGTGLEKNVEEIANEILDILGKPKGLRKIIPDRPGHDTRYLLSSAKIKKELGWKPEIKWTDGLRDTIKWYKNNQTWWQSQ
ncbi:MAG: dTDP-glucose 4,6-dehydratase [Patescibacteria group bacterium]